MWAGSSPQQEAARCNGCGDCRTRTAPADAVENLRFAVVSCSSLWSSYWSGYGHLAARDDLDLVIHCGDYIYDFPDQDELVRSRNGIFDTAHPDFRESLEREAYECGLLKNWRIAS